MKLTFEQIQHEFAPLSKIALKSTKGGLNGNTEYEYAIDSNGYWYYKCVGEQEWHSGSMLSEVEVIFHQSNPNWGNYITSNPFGNGGGSGGSTGGGGSGGGGGGTTGSSVGFDAVLSSFFTTTTTAILSQHTQLNSNTFFGYNGLTTYTGIVTTPTNPNSLLTLDTTIDNGILSSFTLSIGGTASVSLLVGGGFSVSYSVNGVTHTSGISASDGLLYGASVNYSGLTAGYEYNHVPGWGDILLALSIAAALETGGGSMSAYFRFAL